MLTPDLIPAQRSGTGQGAEYTYLDADLPPGDYAYALLAIRLDGTQVGYDLGVVKIE